MTKSPYANIIGQAFEDAIVSTITQLAGIPPRIHDAPELISDGTIGTIFITGGWNGSVSAHCSAALVEALVEQLPALLIDRPKDRHVAVTEILVDSVANAFMRKFMLKSDVSEPSASPWNFARQNRSADMKELLKISCSLPSGPFILSLSQG